MSAIQSVEVFPDPSLFAEGTKIFQRPADFKPNTGASCDLPEKEDYTVASYQYCTTTNPNVMQPHFYVRPMDGDVEGIKLVVEYAARNGLAIAVRSGGHMFGGFSSTNGPNIQIDMKNFKSISGFNATDKTFTVGAGCKLSEVDQTLMDLPDHGGAFISHGMCSWVAIGGHLQSGGFSKDIGRSFGFFIDCITKFDVILPPNNENPKPELITVTKPINPRPTSDAAGRAKDFNRNDELWFAMLGGSPGNFGIATSVTFKPHFNDDHPEARTLIRMIPYSKASYQALLTLAQKWGTKDDLPADFNISLGVYAGNPPTGAPELNNLDSQMAAKFPDIYGPKLGWLPMPGSVVSATWTNLKGRGQWETDTLAHEFFESLDAECDKIMKHLSFVEKLMFDAWMKIDWDNLPQCPLSYKEPTLLSVANCKKLVFAARNQAMPYAACAGIGPVDMPDSYPAWAADIIDDGIVNGKDFLGFRHAFVDNGTGLVGGKFSMNNTKNCNNITALAHRDAGFMVIHYVHWENTVAFQDTDKYRQIGLANCAKWAAGIVEQCKGDRRWNMFPYQAGPPDLTKPVSATNRNQIDCNLDKMKAQYFDSEEVYQRVLSTKRIIDPLEVFTPNLFCVGASTQTKHSYSEDDWTLYQHPSADGGAEVGKQGKGEDDDLSSQRGAATTCSGVPRLIRIGTVLWLLALLLVFGVLPLAIANDKPKNLEILE